MRSAMSTASQDAENDKALPEWLTKIILRSSSRMNRVNPTPQSGVSVAHSPKRKDAAQSWLPVPPERTPSRERREKPRGENAQQSCQSSQMDTPVSKLHAETREFRYCELPPLNQPLEAPTCPPGPQPHMLPRPNRFSVSPDLVQNCDGNLAFGTATPSASQIHPRTLQNTPVKRRKPNGCLQPREALLLPDSTVEGWDATDQRAQDWEAGVGGSGEDVEAERGAHGISRRLLWMSSSPFHPHPKSTCMSPLLASFSLATPPFLTAPFDPEFLTGLPLSDSNSDTLPDVSFTELFGPGENERDLGEAMGGAFGGLTARGLEAGGELRSLSQEQRWTSAAAQILDGCGDHMPPPTSGSDLVALTPHGKFTPGKGRGFKDSPLETAGDSSGSPLDMTWSDGDSPSHSVPGVSSCIPVGPFLTPNTRLFGSTLATPFPLSECSSAGFGDGVSPPILFLQPHLRLHHPDLNTSLTPRAMLPSQPPPFWAEGGKGPSGLLWQQGALGTYLTQKAAAFLQDPASDTAAMARSLLPRTLSWPLSNGPRLVLPDPQTADQIWDTTFDLSPSLKRRKSSGGISVPSSSLPPSMTDPSPRLRLGIVPFSTPSPKARITTPPPIAPSHLLPIAPWVDQAVPVGPSLPPVATPLLVLTVGGGGGGGMAELREGGCGVASGMGGKRSKTPCAESQAVAVRARREKVNVRMRTLQNLVPGAAFMSTEGFLTQTSQHVAVLLEEIKGFCSKTSATGHVPQSDHPHHATLSVKLPQIMSLRQRGISIMRLADVAQFIEGATMDTLYSSHNLRRQGEGGLHVSTPCEYEASDGFGV